MSTIWQELGINETPDIKSIKRAYAKKLKLVKPDEKPVEFQQLHFAYKQALQNANQLAEQNQASNNKQEEVHPETLTEFSHKLNPETAHHQNDSTGPGTESSQKVDQIETNNSQQVIYQYQTEIDNILSKVETVIAHQSRFRLDKWTFIIKSEHILDPEFSWKLGYTLFTRIAQYYNDQQYRDDGDFRIGIEVLSYLNSIFHWDNMGLDLSDYVHDEYGRSIINNMFNCDYRRNNSDLDAVDGLRGAKSIKLISKSGSAPLKLYYHGSGIKRVAAMLLDFVVISPIVIMAHWLSETLFDYSFVEHKHFSLYFSVAIYLVASWLLECSHYQTTPGKYAMGLKVITGGQKKLGLLHGLIRTSVFGVTCLGSYFTVFLNIWLRGILIHDRLSKSYVMDVARSQKLKDERNQ